MVLDIFIFRIQVSDGVAPRLLGISLFFLCWERCSVLSPIATTWDLTGRRCRALFGVVWDADAALSSTNTIAGIPHRLEYFLDETRWRFAVFSSCVTQFLIFFCQCFDGLNFKHYGTLHRGRLEPACIVFHNRGFHFVLLRLFIRLGTYVHVECSRKLNRWAHNYWAIRLCIAQVRMTDLGFHLLLNGGYLAYGFVSHLVCGVCYNTLDVHAACVQS